MFAHLDVYAVSPLDEPAFAAAASGAAPQAPVSLHDLQASGFLLEWYEAVAIVQALCRVILLSGDRIGPAVLGLRQVSITAGGEVSARLEGPRSARSAVQQIGGLLAVLMPPDRPLVGLNAIVLQATADPPEFASVADLSRALAYFERPNGRELLASVYERCLQAIAHAPPAADVGGQPLAHGRSSRALERLAAPMSLAAAPGLAAYSAAARPQASLQEPQPAEASARPRAHLPLAAAFAAIACAAGAAAWFLAGPMPEPVAPGASFSSSSSGTPPTGAAPQATAARNPLPPTGPHAPAATPRPVVRTNAAIRAEAGVPAASSTRPAAGAASPPTGSAAAESHAALAPLLLDGPAPAAATPAARTASAADPSAGRGAATSLPRASVPPIIYSADDPEVQPPRPAARPHIAPPAAGASAAPLTIELIVDAQGAVTSARPVTRPQTLAESMRLSAELSAAKAWRFEPARRNGQPVAYRVRVAIGEGVR